MNALPTLIFVSLIVAMVLGNVYIADTSNNRIRKVTVSTSVITTVAGTGTASYTGDNGPATSATLYYPRGVALDSSGSVIPLISSFFNVSFNSFLSS